MLYRLLFLAILGFSLCAPIPSARALNIGFPLFGARDNYYSGVGDYFGVPYSDVVVVERYGIPMEEVPVVFYVARRAGVPAYNISQMRLSGLSWLDIIRFYGLSPSIFYVPIAARDIGPPYGNAYGYYWSLPQSRWNTIVLRDNDVVNLVNLRFLSSHYRLSPERVIQLRSSGQSFAVINDEFSPKRSVEDIKAKEVKTKDVKAKEVKVQEIKRSKTTESPMMVERGISKKKIGEATPSKNKGQMSEEKSKKKKGSEESEENGAKGKNK